MITATSASETLLRGRLLDWDVTIRVARLVVVTIAAALTQATPGLRASDDETRLLRLTTVVTNVRGDAITGLRPADFELLVDGAVQPVESVEFTTGNAPRIFAILLDEFHIAPQDSARVRESLTRFVHEQLRPDDLAFVIKPLDPLTPAKMQPTRERAPVLDAIAGFEGRKGDFAPKTAFERTYLAQAPGAVAEARAQIVTSGVRAMAARLVQAAAQTKDARAVIVLVTDGFARVRVSREVPGNLLTAIRIANRANAPIYAFRLAGPDGAAVLDPAAAAEAERAIAGLEAVTSQTGGTLVASGQLDAGLRRMARDLDAHYVLAYVPRHASDGKFHTVQIAVKRPDARVQARAIYQAPLSAQLRAAAADAPLPPMRMLRRSTLIQAWSGVTRTANGRSRVVLTWERAPGRSGNPRPVQPAIIVITATAPDGTVLFDDRVAPVTGGAGEDVANRAEFDSAPGRLMVDMKILDPKGIVLDTDAREVDVPDLRKAAATIMPAAIIRARSAREFRTATADPDAPPVAARDFRRTERLLIRVPAYDNGGAPARVSATLLNRWRQPMRRIEAMAEGPTEGVTQFDLPLASLAPGEYTLHLTAAGKASDYLTFRVGG